jgi:ribonuclease P protein component
MFVRQQRFTTKLFDRFFHDRKKTRVQTGDLVWSIKHNTEVSRVAVVVSKKNMKSAVKRNRIRRQLQEIIRQDLLPKLSAPMHIMCLYQKEFKDLDRQQIITDLGKVIRSSPKKFAPRRI